MPTPVLISKLEDAGAFYTAVLEVLQGEIGVFQSVDFDLSLEIGFSRQFEEFAAVLARAVPNAADHSRDIATNNPSAESRSW
jgi:hypothetical protein